MQYTTLSGTDIRVSRICLGSMTWGEQNSERDAHQQLDYALERGVNFIDTAEMYPVPPKADTCGRTEDYIGSWLAKGGKRERVILASKIAGPAKWASWLRGGNSRYTEQNIADAVAASLARLRTDYIDLYQLHWPERPTNFFGDLSYHHKPDAEATPIHETLAALQKQVQAGNIRAIGLSNETPWGMMRFVQEAKAHGLPRVVSVQNPYNLLNRVFETSHAEVTHHENIGLLAYSPLAFGALSGKYLGGTKPAGARMTLFKEFDRYSTERAEAAIGAYKDIADKHGLNMSQMALAYVNSRAFLSANIIGATTMQQLAEDIDSIDTDLSAEVTREIESVHKRDPSPCP